MRKITVVCTILALLFVLAPQSHADDAVKKLGRGFANVITCPFEYPYTMGKVQESDGIFAGVTWGVLAGTVNCLKRAVVGVYEIATFPVPFPWGYEPILTDPEFFLGD